MSKNLPIATPARFQHIFNDALEDSTKSTWNGSATALVPFLPCFKTNRELEQSRGSDKRMTKWLGPTVDILYAFLRPSMRVLAW
jgi:hypothetical protein